MKQLIILFAACLFLMETSRAQDSLHHAKPNPSVETYKTPPHMVYSSEYYMQKSRKMKTAGWILIGAGSVLGITGYLVYQNQINSYTNNLDNALLNTAGSTVMMVGGSAMVVVGIPVLIRSGYYKRKALSMSANLKFEQVQTGISMIQYPAIGLSFQF
jgi:hypothetical protein